MKLTLVKTLSIVLLLILSTAPAQATETHDQTYLEFLEFLGEWGAEDGSWLDPQLTEPELEALNPENDGQEK